MKFRTILVMAGVAALGGYALYDYYSPDSRRARELHIVETLKPDVKPQACLPPDPLQKAFAVAVALDSESPQKFDSDARQRGTIKHECIRERRDASTRASLETAYAKEDDLTTKGRIKAALLELDNPGKCVVEDEGRGEDGSCRYFCRDQSIRLRYAKEGKAKECPMVHEAEGPKTYQPAAVNPASTSAVSK